MNKRTYVRSPKLLAAVRDLPCQSCGREGTTVAAHCNWRGGKGLGIKADDNLIAALCHRCHHEIDAGRTLSKSERIARWLVAHKHTIIAVVRSGNWPVTVPLPNPAYLEESDEE